MDSAVLKTKIFLKTMKRQLYQIGKELLLKTDIMK
jgi:hypothetical protein